jgi:hypothetical protein
VPRKARAHDNSPEDEVDQPQQTIVLPICRSRVGVGSMAARLRSIWADLEMHAFRKRGTEFPVNFRFPHDANKKDPGGLSLRSRYQRPETSGGSAEVFRELYV